MKSFYVRYIGSHSDNPMAEMEVPIYRHASKPEVATLKACIVAGLNLPWSEIEHQDYFPRSQFFTSLQLCDLGYRVLGYKSSATAH